MIKSIVLPLVALSGLSIFLTGCLPDAVDTPSGGSSGNDQPSVTQLIDTDGWDVSPISSNGSIDGTWRLYSTSEYEFSDPEGTVVETTVEARTVEITKLGGETGNIEVRDCSAPSARTYNWAEATYVYHPASVGPSEVMTLVDDNHLTISVPQGPDQAAKIYQGVKIDHGTSYDAGTINVTSVSNEVPAGTLEKNDALTVKCYNVRVTVTGEGDDESLVLRYASFGSQFAPDDEFFVSLDYESFPVATESFEVARLEDDSDGDFLVESIIGASNDGFSSDVIWQGDGVTGTIIRPDLESGTPLNLTVTVNY